MVIIGVVLALLALVVFLFSRGNIELLTPVFLNVTQQQEEADDLQTPTSTAPEVTETPAASGGSTASPSAALNAVYLGEVESGNAVSVASATLNRPGYIVLYRINSQGDSRMLGHSDLLSGTVFNTKVRLDQLIVDDQALVAVLHEDDGDGSFDNPGDGYLTNDGQLVSDIDVVGTQRNYRESTTLERQVQMYLENNF